MVSKLALGCLALVVLTAEGTSEPKKVAAPLPKKEAPEPKEEAPEPKEEAPEPKKKAPEPEKKAPEPEKEKVVTDKAKFDCDSELANWRDAWPKAKADWCCTNEKKGCEGFDCDAGVDKWEHGWSMAKIEHCVVQWVWKATLCLLRVPCFSCVTQNAEKRPAKTRRGRREKHGAPLLC
eukprot:TRINITY_DN2912_c0_g1_i2.p2 TRINITY_DN2912_c0_g1~~TRINITY_DN2912_c0_g1_i2.p2  ORF type:complete len:178 (+),score=42.23 TRINITY_DN2912_c0_g1_i2:71-604(+)